MNSLYPIFVKLEGRACLIVGGGAIAAWKIRALREAGAQVTIVSPTIVPELEDPVRRGLVRWTQRVFEPRDLEGMVLVIAATDRPEVSEQVFAEAERRGVLCNAVDQDDYCSFHVPAIARSGDIKVAISTAGRSPAFAAELRRRYQSELGEDEATFVSELGRLRPHVLEHYDDVELRKRLFQALVQSFRGADSPTTAAPRRDHPGDTTPARAGTVYLVGAGPGAGDLLTARAVTLLETADVVFYDRLVGDEIVDWIPAGTERVYVGKEVGASRLDTGRLIGRAALDGKAVVRLKGGDPTLFGRGGDEMLALMEAGVPYEIVPGVSALTAVPTSAGIPITFRDLSHQVVIRTGYRVHDDGEAPPSAAETTYVYFMTVGRLTEIVEELRQRDGLADKTPVAIVQRGTLPDQRLVIGTIGTIVERIRREPLKPPALVIAGAVVDFASKDANTLVDQLLGQTRPRFETDDAAKRDEPVELDAASSPPEGIRGDAMTDAAAPTPAGFTLWFTGLSGAGKSTLAEAVTKRLRELGRRVEILDGDEVREFLSKGLTFSKEDRDTNVRRIGFVCELLSRNGVIAVSAAISPYRAIRGEVRSRIGERFIEIFVNCPIEQTMKRDVKGLYKRALAGEIENFTGVSDPYEEPLEPEVEVRTDRESIDESVATVIRYLEEKRWLP